MRAASAENAPAPSFSTAFVLTLSAVASPDFVLFALPAILAFIGDLLLLRARAFRMIPPWAAACLPVFLSFLVPKCNYGTRRDDEQALKVAAANKPSCRTPLGLPL